MQYYHIIIFLLAVAIAMSAIAPKIKVPYPVLLMAAGIIVGFIPKFDYIPIDPNVVFLLFLPPILYDAAFNISFNKYKQFKANARTIFMMAISLVLISMVVIAAVVHFWVPDMSWPVAFVIGAILSPPDAAAASGITRSLGLSHQTSTILEGESLINDASALTAYRTALGVAIGGTFVIWKAGLEFAVTILGGCLIGWIMAFLFIYILKKVKFESTPIVSLNLLLPFVAYQFAEEVDVSGVLAVVVLGFLIARHIRKEKIFSDTTITQSKSMWTTLIYLLNGFIFILIGLEFPQALKEIPSSSVLSLVISSFIIYIFALTIRILTIFSHKFRLDKVISIFCNRENHLSEKRMERYREAKSLSWKNALIIGWTGMRGIVSVATAIAIPVTLSNGEAFPHRNNIIFITVVVVILMLLIQGLGLPLLVKWLKIDNEKEEEELEESSVSIPQQ